MTAITKTITIRAPIERVWAALTDPEAIASWMGSEVLSEPLPGGAYAYFDGETTGVYTRLEPPNRLEYTWRQSNWPSEWADSLVRWQLKQIGDETEVRLVHENFPNEEERIGHDEGWDLYWLEPMKAWLEE